VSRRSDDASHLSGLALRVGDRVRFRRASGQHWHEAVVEGRERDGSIALRDTNGASRSIRPEFVEVYVTAARRGRWVPVTTRRWEQLTLFADGVGRAERPRRRR
jgi:hypothetical protein